MRYLYSKITMFFRVFEYRRTHRELKKLEHLMRKYGIYEYKLMCKAHDTFVNVMLSDGKSLK